MNVLPREILICEIIKYLSIFERSVLNLTTAEWNTTLPIKYKQLLDKLSIIPSALLFRRISNFIASFNNYLKVNDQCDFYFLSAIIKPYQHILRFDFCKCLNLLSQFDPHTFCFDISVIRTCTDKYYIMISPDNSNQLSPVIRTILSSDDFIFFLIVVISLFKLNMTDIKDRDLYMNYLFLKRTLKRS